VIGGLDLMDETYKDVWRISIKSLSELADGRAAETENLWELVKTRGEGPERISNHRGVIIESKVYIYGGLIDNENCKDSFYWFDITNNLWIHHKTKVSCVYLKY